MITLQKTLDDIYKTKKISLKAFGDMHDSVLKLQIKLINVAHHDLNRDQIMTFLTFDIFDQLINSYGLPYELAFYILRKSITS